MNNRRGNWFVTLLMLASAALCSNPAHAVPEPPGMPKDTAYWHQTAEGMSQALVKRFWGAGFKDHPKRYYFNYGSDQSDMSTNHYWPQAHAMDVIVDAWLRTSDRRYLDFYPLWWKGTPEFNFSGRPEDPWWNEFVDDMEWIVLAQIRMYESSGNNAYLAKARQMYDDWIRTQWGPEDEAPWHGGITWKTGTRKSKNACSNCPAAIIAARLHRLHEHAGTGARPKQEYLEDAVMIYAWVKTRLFDPQTGAVHDHMNAQGEIGRAVFTYNQGTFIGAAHELYRITGERHYLEDAVKAARYVITRLSGNDGVPDNATSGDGGLFHGIFFRYFVRLINEPDLDDSRRREFHEYITRCATVMSRQGVNRITMLYGGNWRKAPADDASVPLTPHLTGCMLMEAMCILKPLP